MGTKITMVYDLIPRKMAETNMLTRADSGLEELQPFILCICLWACVCQSTGVEARGHL